MCLRVCKKITGLVYYYKSSKGIQPVFYFYSLTVVSHQQSFGEIKLAKLFPDKGFRLLKFTNPL